MLTFTGYGGSHSPDDEDPFDPNTHHQNPFDDHMDAYSGGRRPSPGHVQDSYHMQEQHYGGHQQLAIPMGPGQGPGTPGDRLEAQPTYSVENIPGSFGHNEGYEADHPYNPTTQHPGQGYALNPQDHHDAYYNQPYQPQTPMEEREPLQPYQGHDGQYWQDDVDTRPILQPDSAYGPDPHQIPSPVEQAQHDVETGYNQPGPNAAAIRRWKTVKEVQLFNGNLVLDCPVPPRLLNQIDHAPPPERDEFTHMRYSAATCDPANFYDERFTLRQRLFRKPRHTELFIVVTMYNEEDELFARTMMGVIKNIEFMNSRTSSKTWGKEAWKKIVVCVVSDGRAKINPRTRAVLAAMGVYQDGIAKQQVNGKDVTAHIYEVRDLLQ